MARFYGKVQGSRGPATRLGHNRLQVFAMSYAGDITVDMFVVKGEDWCSINIECHRTGNFSMPGYTHQLYHGRVKDLLEDKKTLIERLAHEALENEYEEKDKGK